MNADETWHAVDEHRERVVDLLRTLTAEEWRTPSWCDGWTVKDVAAHLSIATLASIRQVSGWVVAARGNFNRMIHDSGVEWSAERTTDQVIDDLHGIVGTHRLAPGTFRRDPLLDILVHGQDIARPLGRELALPAEAAREAAEWTWRRRFPFFPARHLRGVRLVADDVDWQRGTGAELTGPIGSLLLLSTGRHAAVSDLAGPGRELLEARFQRPQQ